MSRLSSQAGEKVNPFALPRTGPFLVNTVNWRNGKLRSREIFDTKEEAIPAAKKAAANGMAGVVVDGQGRTLAIYMDENKGTS